MKQSELQELLNALEGKSEAQSPYFDARLLAKIEQIKNLLANWEEA